ncbi:hypothetical protein HYX12_04845 [Candidatus Woesearchaeota archaeon]|nr:hypothetical protein [Candidatus Woesearchaeota archaeon]
MSSTKFIKIAKEIATRDKQVFDALLEFKKTKKIRTKTRLNFTVDKSLAEKFRKFCREHGYNMSAKIEKALEDMLKIEKLDN